MTDNFPLPGDGKVLRTYDDGDGHVQQVAAQFTDENGVVYGVPSAGGLPRVSSRPYTYDIAKGNIAGHIALRKFGSNPDLGVAEETICQQGGVLTYLTAAEQLQVVSADVNDVGTVLSTGTADSGSATSLVDSGADFVTDTVAVGDLLINDTDGSAGIITNVVSAIQLTVYSFTRGVDNSVDASDAYRVVDQSADTGAAVVWLNGLDGNWNGLTEYVVLSGQTDVTTTASFLRVNRAVVVLAGSNGYNEGIIDVEDNASAVVMLRVSAQFNQSLASYWSVPDGYRLYITQCEFGNSKDKGASIRLYARPYGRVLQIKHESKVHSSAMVIPFPLPEPLAGRTDIEARAISDAAGDDVFFNFHGWCEPE